MSDDDHSPRTIFLAALEIDDPDQRAAHLDRACGGDEALRREVEELLQAHSQAGGFLPENPAAPPAVPSSMEGVGDRIGRYKLLQKIGEGGCGVVYMAEQETPVRRKVALKVIKLGMDTRQVIARFEAERQALAMMDHPNIARALDAGATESGRPFFVMELVRGVKITDYCNENELAMRERLNLFVSVCHAVQHAHQKGVIHRDLKPSNILVTVNDGVGIPKVIDFGIAKATEGRLTDQTLFTALEQFLGTPAYMSPEQAALTSLDIDTRSDIYSLGVLLYELLTGSTPFDTKELLASGIDAMRRTIRERQPVRPSTRLGRSLAEMRRPTQQAHLLRGDLDWIIMKCLEKARARRYETANGVALDIQRHLTNQPISARPPSRLYELQKLCHRHKAAFVSAGGVALALLAGIAALVFGLQRAQAEREAARRIGYASDMNLCWKYWTYSGYGPCRRLLRANIPAPGEKDLRGFEWWYLWRLCKGDDLYALGPVSGTIIALGFVPGDRLVVGATQTRPLRAIDVSPVGTGIFIWDWKARRLLATIDQGIGVGDLAVSRDGNRIAVAEWGPTIDVFDGKTYGHLFAHQSAAQITAVAYSPDGQMLAARGEECVLLFRTESKDPFQTLPALKGIMEKPAFTPDSRQVCFMRSDGKIGIWDILSQRFVQALPNAGQAQMSGPDGVGAGDCYTGRHSFSPDGKMLASGDCFGRVMIHDLPSGKFRGIWEHFDYFALTLFSPDGATLASSSYDGVLKLWDPVSGLELATCQGQEGAIQALAYSPDGQYIATGGRDGYVRFWDAHPPTNRVDSFSARREQAALLLTNPLAHFFATAANGNSPNARQLYGPDGRPLTSSRNDTVEQYEAGLEHVLSVGGDFLFFRATNGMFETIDLQRGARTSGYWPITGEQIGAISPDGQTAASFLPDGRIILRDLRVGGGQHELTGPGKRVAALEFSPDGKMLAAGSRDGWAKVWRVGDLAAMNQAALPQKDPFEGCFALAFAWDSDSVAFAESGDEHILILGVSAQAKPRFLAFPYSHSQTTALAFSRDGAKLVATCYAEQAALYDVRTGRVQDFIGDGNANSYTRAEFSPDGRRLALAGTPGTITLWDLDSKRSVLPLFLTGDFVLDGLRFNAAGDRLAVTLTDQTCRVFAAPRFPLDR